LNFSIQNSTKRRAHQKEILNNMMPAMAQGNALSLTKTYTLKTPVYPKQK
jgi:hypothetical protein